MKFWFCKKQTTRKEKAKLSQRILHERWEAILPYSLYQYSDFVARLQIRIARIPEKLGL